MFIFYARFVLLLGSVCFAHATAASHLESPSLARQEQSLPCAQQGVRGFIQVQDASNRGSGPLGLVAQAFTDGGLLTITVDNECDHIYKEPMQVMLHHHCDSNKPFTVETLNSLDTTVRDVGAVVGFDSTNNFGTRSWRGANYAWIAQTGFVPRGPAQSVVNTYINHVRSDAEGTIWTLQDGPGGPLLVPSWVNTDGSIAPRVTLAYIPRTGALAITDDVQGFAWKMGDVQVVKFKFLPLE
ncbi:hypothetical protein C8Q70DRAFT_653317 [Cubamyces menziesii]|nr:hypothetical protein C8Q70DRAFT_653317 [Cubamyces menziesii]